MRLFLLAATATVLALALNGCSIIYKLPTRQGNVIEQKQLDQLKTGMTREQVHYLLGTPVASSSLQPDRWDYVGYYRSPRGEITQRLVSLYFADDRLARMEGTEATKDNTKAIDEPNVKKVLEAQKQAAKEDVRAESQRAADAVVAPEPSAQQP